MTSRNDQLVSHLNEVDQIQQVQHKDYKLCIVIIQNSDS